ncbi:MAG TPA: sigma-54 dependent transcriptional regulator [Burkholderiaceae bacterium]|nr:sigma-54 dependent transcriptional regulator [Burkholderiaceae bacterium]
MAHILIVEDDENSAEMLSALVATYGFTSAIARNLAEARQQLVFRQPSVILLDLNLPDGSGLDLFEDPELRGEAEVVLITGHASIETSVQALRVGAVDYLVKPINVAHLKRVLSRLSQPNDPRREITELKGALEESGRFGHLWGRSASMRTVYDQIARVAPTAVSVLITGESGTGKEVVAQTIHDLSRRRKQPFLAVNCGAISPQLIESELFGHEKGSFTGAMRQHRGFFERAHGGTLFLDEITEMPPELQVKLLRVLETGAFMRIGSDELIETDVRIVAATNRDPQQAVAAGKLREDLYYRLNVFQISLSPLRERIEDAPLLARHFLERLNTAEGTNRRFSDEALAQLSLYHFPGNVRELRNLVQRAAIMADGTTIHHVPLPDHPQPAAGRETPAAAAPPAPAPADTGPTFTVRVGTPIAEVERQLILATLQLCGNVKDKTAETLGISLKTLYNRLRDYEQQGLLTPPDLH